MATTTYLQSRSTSDWAPSSNGLQKVYGNELVCEGTPICIDLSAVFAEWMKLTGSAR